MTQHSQDTEVRLEQLRSNAGFDGFAVVVGPERVGSLGLRDEGRSTVSVRWNIASGPERVAQATAALHLAMEEVFVRRGASRIEARVPVDRTDDVRAASIAGLRKEGLVRGHGEQPDRLLVARLVDDPPLTTPGAFISILNAGLPTKRVIAQGLWRDPAGRVLLCELTYKSEWDLPGGVVEPGESPEDGLVRELSEELGVTVQPRELITVSWLPPWRHWDDACVFLFDLGVIDPMHPATFTLEQTEIAAMHWCDPATVRQRATAVAADLLGSLQTGPLPVYREARRAD